MTKSKQTNPEEKAKFLQEKNTPSNYVAIRVSAVHVRKRLGFFWTDEELCRSVAIPDDHKKAVELFERITAIMKEYGIEVKMQ